VPDPGQGQFPATETLRWLDHPGGGRRPEIDVTAYPHRFLTFDITQVHLYGLNFKMRSPQHSIRRYEFDDWLLQRSGAPVTQHDVKRIVQHGGRFVIDDSYTCDYLIGAGGSSCPVYRALFRAANPRARLLQVVASSTSSLLNGQMATVTCGSSTRVCQATAGTYQRRPAT